MTQLVLSNDLSTITAEILAHKGMLASSVFEIGARLKHVRENDMVHGQWEQWCENECGITAGNARRYIRVYDRFSNRALVHDMGMKKMDMLTEFTDEQLETPVSLPSGETKPPIEMSQKEIQQYKKAQAEAEKRAAEAERRAKEAEERAEREETEKYHFQKLYNQEKQKPTEIRVREVEKIPDSLKNELNNRKHEVEGLKRSLEETQKALEESKNLQQLYKKDSTEYAELKKQISFLHKEKDDLHRQIDSATALSGLAVEIDNFIKTKLSPIRYSRALERLDSEVALRNLTEIIHSVEQWVDDMRRYLPKNKRIEVEVIDQ